MAHCPQFSKTDHKASVNKSPTSIEWFQTTTDTKLGINNKNIARKSPNAESTRENLKYALLNDNKNNNVPEGFSDVCSVMVVGGGEVDVYHYCHQTQISILAQLLPCYVITNKFLTPLNLGCEKVKMSSVDNQTVISERYREDQQVESFSYGHTAAPK